MGYGTPSCLEWNRYMIVRLKCGQNYVGQPQEDEKNSGEDFQRERAAELSLSENCHVTTHHQQADTDTGTDHVDDHRKHQRSSLYFKRFTL